MKWPQTKPNCHFDPNCHSERSEESLAAPRFLTPFGMTKVTRPQTKPNCHFDPNCHSERSEESLAAPRFLPLVEMTNPLVEMTKVLVLMLSIIISVLCLQVFAEETSRADLGEVVLSWEEMKKMLSEIETLKQDIKRLKDEQAKAKQKKKEPLPVTYSITESHFSGEVKGKSAQFSAKFSVQILKDGWVKIPFFQNDVGIETITINETNSEQQFAQFVRESQGYYLVAKGPKTLTIEVTFRVPIQVKELTYSLSFIPPRAVINHISLRIPEKGVNVVQMTSHSQLIQEDEVTTIESVLSERDPLKLSWKVEKDSSINRKSQAVLHSLASVNKSDIFVLSSIILKHVTSLDKVAFRLPLNVEILNVTSLHIEQWSTEKLADAQVIKIAGQSDPRTELKIDLSYRLRLSALPAELAMPTVAIIGTDTLEGFLGVEAVGNIEVNSKQVKNGVLIPAKNLPKLLWQKASNPLLYGYQFYGNRFSPSVNIRGFQEIQTVVANVDLVDGVTHRTLEGKSITRLLYFIRNNDRQFLTLTLPKNSRIWQAFLNGKPVKPAQKNSGEILIPMKKSSSQGGELESFSIEIGYITEVNKLTLKGDIQNQLPAIDIPISYLRWTLYLPEYYEYSKFEGLLKQVKQFSKTVKKHQTQINIPTQGQQFLFEKHLIVDGRPYVRGKYGQFLGDDIFLSLPSRTFATDKEEDYQYNQRYNRRAMPSQQVTPNR